ncbi:MAG: hypothetical protein Q7J15_11325 [Candidatus Desulfaltia sp.]|nr:hypothetical protein [Candidatus Desulfaltia sp.]
MTASKTEAMIYKGYIDTPKGVAARKDVDLSFLSDELSGTKVEYGEHIHHREAPQAIMDGRADFAVCWFIYNPHPTILCLPYFFAMMPGHSLITWSLCSLKCSQNGY